MIRSRVILMINNHIICVNIITIIETQLILFHTHRYDVLVHHVDQIEQDINEPYPEMELRTESVAPQMDPIAEEGEEGSHIDDEVRY